MARGFALGFARAYNEDVARKKELVAQLNNAKREWLFKTGISRIESLRKQRDEKLKRIGMAQNVGFDKEAAVVLEASGELSYILERVDDLRKDPDRDFSKAGVRKMSQAILDNVPEERVAQAMNYALEIGAVGDMDGEKLIDVIFSATDEEGLDKARDVLASIPTSVGGGGFGPVGVTNLSGLTQLTPEKAQSARKLIEDRLKGTLATSVNEDGNVVFDNPTAAGVIVNKAFNYYLEQRANPTIQSDVVDVTSDITDKVGSLIGSGVQLDDIASGYDFTMNPAEFKAPAVTPPPPGGGQNDNSTDATEIIERNFRGQ